MLVRVVPFGRVLTRPLIEAIIAHQRISGRCMFGRVLTRPLIEALSLRHHNSLSGSCLAEC